MEEHTRKIAVLLMTASVLLSGCGRKGEPELFLYRTNCHGQRTLPVA